MKLLANKVAVISGGAHPKGIGKATARLFAQHGAKVVILDLDEAAALNTALDIDDTLSSVTAFRCDVSSAVECRDAIGRVLEWSDGRIDALVNNAGVTQKAGFQDISEEDFDRITDVNFKSVYLLSREVLPTMQSQGAGSIICIASLSAQNGGGIFGGAHYCGAKAGVLGLSRAMAREFGPQGIRVNAITPGLITTDFSKTGRSDASKDESAKDWPLRRAGRPHEIAGGCLFLASDLSAYVTGTTLDINGGAHMN